jgi:hypothetical protein
MSIGNERPRASRLAENAGTVLVYLGVVGLLAAITLAIWALRDLSNQVSQIGVTVKIELVTTVGITPALLSLLVIAAGIFLQSRASEPSPSTGRSDGDGDDYGRGGGQSR